MQARLTKSRTDRIIDGVCGGLAEYLGIDSVIVRLVFIVLGLINGLGVLVYILLVILMPRSEQTAGLPADAARGNVWEQTTQPGTVRRRADRGVLGGTILILLGVIFLLGNFQFLRWFRFDLLWPLVLIGLGILLVTGRLGKSRRADEQDPGSSLVVQQTQPLDVRAAGASDLGHDGGQSPGA